MKQQTYFKVSGCVFFIVALVHAWRILSVTPVAFGTAFVPMWLSWIGVVLAGTLAYQGLKKR
jgi:hypothetical protein